MHDLQLLVVSCSELRPAIRVCMGSQLRTNACCKMRAYEQENLVQFRLETITYIPSGLLTGAFLGAFGSIPLQVRDRESKTQSDA